MAIERSAGAVVFRKVKDERFYLLIQYGLGHWEFPRGNLAKGEGWQAAAAREIIEETGLTDIKFVPGFKEVSKYFYKKDAETVFKIVTYFLAQTEKEKIELSFEHRDYRWLEFEAALTLVTYTEGKAVLKKAEQFFLSGGGAAVGDSPPGCGAPGWRGTAHRRRSPGLEKLSRSWICLLHWVLSGDWPSGNFSSFLV